MEPTPFPDLVSPAPSTALRGAAAPRFALTRRDRRLRSAQRRRLRCPARRGAGSERAGGPADDARPALRPRFSLAPAPRGVVPPPATYCGTAAAPGEALRYLDNGSRAVMRSAPCNTVVVRATLRQAGVPLAGPEPATLVDPLAIEPLRGEILAAIRERGRAIPGERNLYENRFYQGFIVLSYCRMLRDLKAGKLGSKRAGAEWAKAQLDPSWSGLIDRATPESCRLGSPAARPGRLRTNARVRRARRRPGCALPPSSPPSRDRVARFPRQVRGGRPVGWAEDG